MLQLLNIAAVTITDVYRIILFITDSILLIDAILFNL
jgi:hypothetical protein